MSESPISLRDETGVERFRGTQSPGGGSQPSVSWKEACAAATTENLDALSGLLTVDFYTLQEGDRVLVIAQSGGGDNGIYIASAGAWVRADDANTSGSIVSGTKVAIGASGNAFAAGIFSLLPSDDPWVPGTTNLSGVCIAGTTVLSISEVTPEGAVTVNFTATQVNMGSAFVLLTSDPGIAGALWNDAGTPAISTGPPGP